MNTSGNPKLNVLICARGNSKGIPEKNKRKLNGLTLVERAIATAKKVVPATNIYLSTECPKILDSGRALGAQDLGLRPAELSKDNIRQVEVAEHFFNQLSILETEVGSLGDVWCLLQTTSPFVKSEHLCSAFQDFLADQCEVSVVSGYLTGLPVTSVYQVKSDKRFVERIVKSQCRQRQSVPEVFVNNGAIRVFSRANFEKTAAFETEISKPLIMEESDSLNLDTMNDWMRAEIFFENEEKAND